MKLRLFFYFCAQVFYVPFVWTAYFYFGLGPQYGRIYSFFTALILLTVVAIAWHPLSRYKYRLRVSVIPIILALAAFRIVTVQLGRPLEWFDWILLLQSMVLFWSGATIGMVAIYMRQPRVAITLAMYWLAQSFYGFGFVLAYPLWLSVNTWVPPALGVVAYLVAMRFLRDPIDISRS